MNRLVSKTYSDGTLASCFQYDGSEANGNGRLWNEWTQASSCASTLPMSGYVTLRRIDAYDALGRVAQEQQCIPNSCNTTTDPQLWYGYDLAGNPTGLTNSATPVTGGSLVLTTGFDSAGHMNSVNSNWTAYPTSLYAVPVGGYGPVGPLNWTFGPSLTVTQSYTNRLWVNNINAAGQVP